MSDIETISKSIEGEEETESIEPCECPDIVQNYTVCGDKTNEIDWVFWSSFSEKRLSLVRDIILNCVRQFSYSRSVRSKNFCTGYIPLKTCVNGKIKLKGQGPIQIHVLWPSFSDILCATFKNSLGCLISIFRYSRHFLVVVCPTDEDKKDIKDKSHLQWFKNEMSSRLQNYNLKFVVFDELDIPHINETFFGRRVRDLYFDKSNCLRRAGWVELCHQLACVLKSFSYSIYIGEAKPEIAQDRSIHYVHFNSPYVIEITRV